MTDHCHFCSSKLGNYIDFGNLVICNRFLRSPRDPEETFNFTIAQCEGCGLIQVPHPAPSEAIRSRYSWIKYNEPQGHLEAMVARLVQLPGITTDSSIGAIVFGEDESLNWFHRQGFTKTWRVDVRKDLGSEEPNAGVETIQQRMTPARADKIAECHGKFDLLIIRHMLEHAHHPLLFVEAIKRLMKPGGYAVFEVPNCETAFNLCDYTILWEEHVSYFTLATFEACLRAAGLEVLDLQRPPPSLVAIVQSKKQGDRQIHPRQSIEIETTRMLNFVNSFPKAQKSAVASLDKLRASEGKISFFGAGHLGCIYINLMGLKRLLEFVADDDSNKQGLWMPGSHLPILSSNNLEDGIKVCLSTLGEATERRIAEKHRAFTSSRCRFVSILPGRANSLPCA
jgi:SAM-dependent methyltransferase